MRDYRIATFSDIHLGHRKNSAGEMIEALDQLIFGDRLLERIDMLIFAGDVFERLLDLDYPYLDDIDHWIARILTGCARHGVSFRLLKGTHSHDQSQPERFVTLASILQLENLDFKYFDKLDIERHEDSGADILYVPDNLSHDSSETLANVKELMAARGIDQVDIAVMHGMFDYQQPEGIVIAECHNSMAYKEIVKTIIFIGHVHTHSRNGIIVAQGSTDRLKHGEEEPKGFVIAEIQNNKAEIYFIENKLARVYNTVKVYGMDLQDTLGFLEKYVEPLPGNACIRVEAEPSHPVFSNMEELTKLYPTISWSKLPKDVDDTEVKEVVFSETELQTWVPISLNKTNIVDTLLNLLQPKLTETELSYIGKELQELI